MSDFRHCITMKTQMLFLISIVGLVTAASNSHLGQDGLVDASTKFNKMSGRLGMFKGQNTTINKNSYLVSIVENGTPHCGGTILNTRWVLTAGDCQKNITPADMTVVSGSNDGVTGSSYPVAKIVTHPNYGKVHLDYDYALIQITGEFKWSNSVKAAKLPTKEVLDYTWLNVAGYGRSNVSGASNNPIQHGKLQWLNKDVCKSMFSMLPAWTDTFACAYNAGKTTLCKGDFGDGIVKNDVIYGIFTAGLTANFCSVNSMPCILADVFPVVPWIITTISSS